MVSVMYYAFRDKSFRWPNKSIPCEVFYFLFLMKPFIEASDKILNCFAVCVLQYV